MLTQPGKWQAETGHPPVQQPFFPVRFILFAGTPGPGVYLQQDLKNERMNTFSRFSIAGGGMILAMLLSFALLPGCQHDPFATDITDPGDTTNVNPGTPCDPQVVYFETQVLPILQSNCALSGCHDEASHEEGIVLTSFTRVMQTADIRPGNASRSELYEALTDNDPDKKMPPPPRQGLTQEQISLIANWINQGAKNLRCDTGAGPCETADRSWAQHIKPIIQTYCLGCHSGTTPGAGLNFSTHAGVAASTANGRLYGAVNHQQGYVAMPPTGAKMPECQIMQIKSWIDAGAPNN